MKLIKSEKKYKLIKDKFVSHDGYVDLHFFLRDDINIVHYVIKIDEET